MAPPRLSGKVEQFVPSLTLALKDKANERRNHGLPVYDFGLGETRGKLNQQIADAASAAYQEGRTQYADPAGLPELRAAVLDWLELSDHYDVGNVLVTTGAKQSLLNVFLALADPGDCLLFDCAPWVSYEPLAIAASARSVLVEPSGGTHNRLKISGADLERTLTDCPRARLFLLNSPCNPTGQVYDRNEIEDLIRVCAANEIYFVLDRLYWRLVFDQPRFPAPEIDDETAPWIIQIDGLSKNFRRTGGLRIGWTVAPDDVAAAMINLQSHYTSGPSVPAQHAALAAISTAFDDEMVQAIGRKAKLMRREAEALPLVEVWPTAGTFYSFWDVRDCVGKKAPDGFRIQSSADVCAYLLETCGVVTAPGEAFHQPGFLRLSITLPDDELTAGVRAAAETLGRLT